MGFSNLSVDKIYSIVALRMQFFFFFSNNLLPFKRVSYKENSVKASNVQSILFKVLRRVNRSSLNVGQWRRKCEVDSISKPQLHIGFKQSWKLCLNLCSHKWLITTRSRVIRLIPLWLLQLKALVGEGLINFRILFLKSIKLIEFLRVGSRLFHSMIVEGKKEFLKKLSLVLKQGMFSTFLVAYAWVFWVLV